MSSVSQYTLRQHSMSAIIKVENLGKKYTIRHEHPERYVALRDVMAQQAKKLFSFPKKWRTDNAKPDYEEFWALKDLNFEIQQGDRVGIIGRNGAGKSTLLKILSRITEPSTGRIELNGRVASLLEVGTGFHPELTGRENIFLNGAILGMSRVEIRRKFDEIVDFSGVEKFLDTPVKRYSSGMYVRLAFAVAAHLEPEILVVDEVLAVGDAEFQKKCLGKMEDVSKNEGRTVIFVSHNMGALQNLCNKGIVLKSGLLEFSGPLQQSIIYYNEQFTSGTRSIKYDIDNAPGNEAALFISASIKSIIRTPNEPIRAGDPLQLDFNFYNKPKHPGALDVTFHLVDELGQLVFVGSTIFSNDHTPPATSGYFHACCIIPANLMNEGIYNIQHLLLVKDRGNIIWAEKDVIQFEIMNAIQTSLGWMGKKEGVVKPKFDWTVQNESVI